MAEQQTFSVRAMRPEEVPQAHRLTEKEDFGLSKRKHELLFQTFPEAFFVIVDQSEQVFGAVTFVETILGTFELGYMVISQEKRGCGLGRRLVEGVKQLVAPKAVALTLGPNTESFYRKLGFKPSDTLKTHKIYIMAVDTDDLAQYAPQLSDPITITPLQGEEPTDELVAYDNLSRNYDNRRFMTFLVRYYKVFIAKDASTQNIVGFAAAVVENDMLTFAGLYADSNPIAFMLFKKYLDEFPDTEIVKIQTFGDRTYLTSLGEVINTIVCPKFNIGDIPPVPEDRLYCVCDCEFTL